MRLFTALLVCLIAAFAAPVTAAPPKEIFAFSNAFVRETPSKNTAGYFTITNNGEEDDMLQGVSAEWAGRIQLHDVKTGADGVMEMVPMESIAVKKGETVTFSPAGRHLMIYDVTEKLVAGQTKTVIFHFDKAGAVNATFDVKPITYSGEKSDKKSDAKADAKKADKKVDAEDDMKEMDHSHH